MIDVQLAKAQQKIGLDLSTISRLMHVEPAELDLALWNAMPGAERVSGPMKRIAVNAAADHLMTLKALMVPSRTRYLVRARQHAMRQMQLAGYSYAAIGRFFGVAHSTVYHAVKHGRAA